MAVNTAISQGNLNRIRGSVVFPSNPDLNVTAEYLGTGMISIAFDGNVTDFINTATGRVTSQVPYLPVTVTINLLRTQSLAQTWLTQAQTNSLLGTATVVPDATTLNNITIQNCAIMTVPGQSFDGGNPDFPITIGGYMIVNSELWETS